MEKIIPEQLQEFYDAGWKIDIENVVAPSGNLYVRVYLSPDGVCPICDRLLDAGSEEEICIHDEQITEEIKQARKLDLLYSIKERNDLAAKLSK